MFFNTMAKSITFTKNFLRFRIPNEYQWLQIIKSIIIFIFLQVQYCFIKHIIS